MAKLTMTTKPEKASINNSGEKSVGIELYLDQITRAEPFASLFTIRPEVLEAIKSDMMEKGFDPSKPVNVWKKEDGTRVLVDGYTRVRAAEELGFLRVTAYEKTFGSEEEAVAYAIHTQKDRRNLSDAELLRLIEVVDRRQEGFHAPLAPNGANQGNSGKTAVITADAIGISARKVERARAVLSDPVEADAVRRGEKTIHQAAETAKARRDPIPRQSPAGSKLGHRSKTTFWTEEDALSEGHRILLLLNALSASDPDGSRRTFYRSAEAMVRRALK